MRNRKYCPGSDSRYQCITDDCNHGNFVSLDESNRDKRLVLEVVDGHRVVLSRKVR